MIKPVPISQIRQKYRHFKINRKWVLGILAFWVLSFLIDVWPIIFLSIFCAANAILLSIDRYLSAPIDIELSTFSAVLMTLKYGLYWGIAVAIMTKLAAIMYNRNIRADHFFMILGYIIAALFANLLGWMPIVLLGILVTVIVNIYVVFISKFVTMLSSYEIFMYGTSNIIFNSVLFVGFADLFFLLMR